MKLNWLLKPFCRSGKLENVESQFPKIVDLHLAKSYNIISCSLKPN